MPLGGATVVVEEPVLKRVTADTQTDGHHVSELQ